MLDLHNGRIDTKYDNIQYIEKTWIPSSEFEKNGNSSYLRDSERIFKLITYEYQKYISKLRGGEKKDDKKDNNGRDTYVDSIVHGRSSECRKC